MLDETVTEQDSVADETVVGGYPRLQRRYEHYKIGYRRYKRIYLRSLVVAVVLGIACTGFAALFVSGWLARKQIEDEKFILLRQVGLLEARLANAEYQLQVSDQPGLVPFEYDRLVPVQDSYVKAIELSRPDSGSGDVAYQLLIENIRTHDLIPDVSLELFDRSGSVVGTHRLDVRASGLMRAGSAQSVSGSFIESAHARVAFFRVKTK